MPQVVDIRVRRRVRGPRAWLLASACLAACAEAPPPPDTPADAASSRAGAAGVGERGSAPSPSPAAKADGAAGRPADRSPLPVKHDEAAWTAFFDGRSLAGWKVAPFGGHGAVEVREGVLVLEMGEATTGVAWAGGAGLPALPRMGYEAEVEARRVEGHDFFCGLTFPVGDGAATLICGGWGGRLVGLSCIDGYDASENETTQGMKFERGRWYRVRVRVTPGKIAAWIDDAQVVDVDTEGKRIAVRADIEEALPFGVAAWRTAAEIRGIRLRALPPR